MHNTSPAEKSTKLWDLKSLSTNIMHNTNGPVWVPMRTPVKEAQFESIQSPSESRCAFWHRCTCRNKKEFYTFVQGCSLVNINRVQIAKSSKSWPDCYQKDNYAYAGSSCGLMRSRTKVSYFSRFLGSCYLTCILSTSSSLNVGLQLLWLSGTPSFNTFWFRTPVTQVLTLLSQTVWPQDTFASRSSRLADKLSLSIEYMIFTRMETRVGLTRVGAANREYTNS